MTAVIGGSYRLKRCFVGFPMTRLVNEKEVESFTSRPMRIRVTALGTVEIFREGWHETIIIEGMKKFREWVNGMFNLNLILFASVMILIGLNGQLSADTCEIPLQGQKDCTNQLFQADYSPSEDPAYANWMDQLFPPSAGALLLTSELQRMPAASSTLRKKLLRASPRAPLP